ncbi:hypothetical protein WOLCODRAFT_85692, partial [Wolfiporia cocos MD-104 SS10]
IGYTANVPRVVRKESDLNGEQALRAGAIVATDKKVTAGTNKAHPSTDHQRIAKLDRENEVVPPQKVAPSVGKAIQAARMERQIKQKDLAQKVNEKLSVIQGYESGHAIPDPQILGKLERILEVKLRGCDIGKRLGGSKS